MIPRLSSVRSRSRLARRLALVDIALLALGAALIDDGGVIDHGLLFTLHRHRFPRLGSGVDEA